MIGIIDYGSGNINAIVTILREIKADFVISNQVNELENSDGFILPGVGAFDTTIRSLNNTSLKHFLDTQVLGNKKNILGICVGMHLLALKSEEGELTGLNYIPGEIKKIDVTNLDRPPHLPHMGWNSLKVEKDDPLLKNIDLNEGFYFLHSYFFETINSNNVIATVNYGKNIPCVVRNENIWGVQFHPEKSHKNGFELISNFIKLCSC